MGGQFTKTQAGAGQEVLTTTPVSAVTEVFFMADENNAGTVEITDSLGAVRLRLLPSGRDRVPVDFAAVFNPVTGLGDFFQLAGWKSQGVAADKIYVDAR